MSHYNILHAATQYGIEYLDSLNQRRVFPSREALQQLEHLSFPLPDEGLNDAAVLERLHTVGSQNTVASNGGRYFGFVFGATLPASMAASWLAAAWDQNAAFKISSPIAAFVEKVAAQWLLELLHLPMQSAVGFVTGTTMANFSAVVAARFQLCRQMGWDVKAKGLHGAPAIRVIVGEEVHASMQRALLLAGFGLENLIKVPTDSQGRIVPEAFPPLDASTFVCLQAGNVNTGVIDPVREICQEAKEKGAWVHVDGAFGLWAAASPAKRAMTDGMELADSWAVDLHKWLNVPYDSGLVVCKHPEVLRNALSVTAAYLPDSAEAEPCFYTPELSRKARGIETWAALCSLGKKGVVELVERCCRLAQKFADNLKGSGFHILNDVVLNQVLVSFGEAECTNRIIKRIQEDGTCWCGGTVWKGTTAMRISVSSWMTTTEDIELCSEVIVRIANEEIKKVSASV